MIFKSFDNQFPHLVLSERCQVMLSGEKGQISAFNFLDEYCSEPSCNCCQVKFVVEEHTTHKIYATILYGWKPPSFYHQLGMDKKTIKQLTEGFFPPSEKQSQFADSFLEPFSMMIRDPNFIKRLEDRYARFKEDISTSNNVVPLKAG